jgi:putative transcriptional regulator
LVAGLNDALAHARGQLELPSYTVTVPEKVDVAKLRHRLGLSQSDFARTFGLDVTALHAWEQGRRRPDVRRVFCSPLLPRSRKRCCGRLE